MPNVIEFPRAPEPPGTSSQTVRSICIVIESLSRTLDNVRTLCAAIPHGPVREQLEAERARLLVGLFTVRQTAARLASTGASPAVLEVSDRPVTLHH